VLGYVEAELLQDTIWGPAGATLRGHEFHYSELVGDGAYQDGWKPAYRLRRPGAVETREEGFTRGTILASYVHLHLASQPQAIEHFKTTKY
jgi:cobyrinic acid a,c-diamide synthase